MIRFPCPCNHRFELDDEMAGDVVQCPKCGRLNDVPTRDDLPALQEDGTYSLELSPMEPAEDPEDRLRELQRTFTPRRTDDEGNDIDLRGAVGEEEDDEDEILPLKPRDPEPVTAEIDRTPKYDPVTGELIRPLELREEPPAAPRHAGAGPVPAEPESHPPKLSYAAGETARSINPTSLFLNLLLGANPVVMLFIGFMHVLAQFSMWALGLVLSMVGVGAHWVTFPISALIIAHYGNTIDDIATEGRDELPRPLRETSWSDDLWGPFVRVMFAWLICYGPAALVLTYMPTGPTKLPALTVAWIAGSFLFPAVVMTTVCGITIVNLRPDRVLGVIGACGGSYFVSWGLIMALMPLYVWFVMGWSPYEEVVAAFPIVLHLGHPAVWLGLLAVCVYLAHYFCWHLSLMYRKHFEQFHWEGMKYIKPQDPHVIRRPRKHTPRTPPEQRLEELRAAERQRQTPSMRDRV